jgi:hypothetical protein
VNALFQGSNSGRHSPSRRRTDVYQINLIQKSIQGIMTSEFGKIGLHRFRCLRMFRSIRLQDIGVLIPRLLSPDRVLVIKSHQPRLLQKLGVDRRMCPLKDPTGTHTSNPDDLIFMLHNPRTPFSEYLAGDA